MVLEVAWQCSACRPAVVQSVVQQYKTRRVSTSVLQVGSGLLGSGGERLHRRQHGSNRYRLVPVLLGFPAGPAGTIVVTLAQRRALIGSEFGPKTSAGPSPKPKPQWLLAAVQQTAQNCIRWCHYWVVVVTCRGGVLRNQ